MLTQRFIIEVEATDEAELYSGEISDALERGLPPDQVITIKVDPLTEKDLEDKLMDSLVGAAVQGHGDAIERGCEAISDGINNLANALSGLYRRIEDQRE